MDHDAFVPTRLQPKHLAASEQDGAKGGSSEKGGAGDMTQFSMALVHFGLIHNNLICKGKPSSPRF